MADNAIVIHTNDTLIDGRTVIVKQDYGSTPQNYDPTTIVYVWTGPDGSAVCSSDSAALCRTYGGWTCNLRNCAAGPNGNYTPVAYSDGGRDRPSSNSSGLQGILDTIQSLISTLNDVFSGGLFGALKDAATALQTLPNVLGSIISEITGSQNDILQQLKQQGEASIVYLEAIHKDISVSLVNAIGNESAVISDAINNLGGRINEATGHIADSINGASNVISAAIQSQGKLIAEHFDTASDVIKSEIAASANKVSAAIGIPLAAFTLSFDTASTLMETSLASIAAGIGSLVTEIGSAQTVLGANIIKIIAIITAAIAIPTLTDFDRVKDFLSGALVWLAEQQMDVSRKVYEKIKNKGSVT